MEQNKHRTTYQTRFCSIHDRLGALAHRKGIGIDYTEKGKITLNVKRHESFIEYLVYAHSVILFNNRIS